MYWITIVYNNGDTISESTWTADSWVTTDNSVIFNNNRRESHNNLSKEELNRYFNSIVFDETVSHVNYGES